MRSNFQLTGNVFKLDGIILLSDHNGETRSRGHFFLSLVRKMEKWFIKKIFFLQSKRTFALVVPQLENV